MTREEAIELVKEAMPTLWKTTKDAIQTLIPELAESEDERIERAIIDTLRRCNKGEKFLNDNWALTIDDVHTYLEKQKEQKPTEWSEEDENRFRNLIYLVLDSDEGKGTKDGFIKFIQRLKSSLRPQPHWKPSDEQMGSLRLAIDSAKKAQMNATADTLNEIYEQIKKL